MPVDICKYLIYIYIHNNTHPILLEYLYHSTTCADIVRTWLSGIKTPTHIHRKARTLTYVPLTCHLGLPNVWCCVMRQHMTIVCISRCECNNKNSAVDVQILGRAFEPIQKSALNCSHEVHKIPKSSTYATVMSIHRSTHQGLIATAALGRIS
jgi:hypothetical protein